MINSLRAFSFLGTPEVRSVKQPVALLQYPQPVEPHVLTCITLLFPANRMGPIDRSLAAFFCTDVPSSQHTI